MLFVPIKLLGKLCTVRVSNTRCPMLALLLGNRWSSMQKQTTLCLAIGGSIITQAFLPTLNGLKKIVLACFVNSKAPLPRKWKSANWNLYWIELVFDIFSLTLMLQILFSSKSSKQLIHSFIQPMKSLVLFFHLHTINQREVKKNKIVLIAHDKKNQHTKITKNKHNHSIKTCLCNNVQSN